MSFIGDFFSSGIEGIGKAVDAVLGNFDLDGEKKAQAKIQLETLIYSERMAREETFRRQLEAQQAVLVAELSQGDAYTKRARPTLVYAGLVAILWNYCVVPVVFGAEPIALPVEFYAAWGGVTATWSIGRTRERIGKADKVTKAIIG